MCGFVTGWAYCSLTAAVFLHRPEDDDFDIEEEMRKLTPKPSNQPELEPRSRRGLIGDPRVSVIPEGGGPGDSEEESDSDGPILYREDEESDEDEEGPPSKFHL